MGAGFFVGKGDLLGSVSTREGCRAQFTTHGKGRAVVKLPCTIKERSRRYCM